MRETVFALAGVSTIPHAYQTFDNALLDYQPPDRKRVVKSETFEDVLWKRTQETDSPELVGCRVRRVVGQSRLSPFPPRFP